MRKTRFTEEQMVAILREQEAGVSVEEICRKHAIANQTFYAWMRIPAKTATEYGTSRPPNTVITATEKRSPRPLHE